MINKMAPRPGAAYLQPRSRDIRVVVFDQCPLFREGLTQILNTSLGFRVLHSTEEADDVIGLVVSSHADVVVIDLDTGPVGTHLIEEIKRSNLPVRVVTTLTDPMNPALMIAIRFQVDGVLSKRLTGSQLVVNLRSIAGGDMVISEVLTTTLAKSFRRKLNPAESRNISVLSPRELQVLKCIAAGMSNLMISKSLGITEGTVKVHVKHLLKKLAFSSRVEAALWASDNGHRADPDMFKLVDE